MQSDITKRKNSFSAYSIQDLVKMIQVYEEIVLVNCISSSISSKKKVSPVPSSNSLLSIRYLIALIQMTYKNIVRLDFSCHNNNLLTETM